MVLADTRRLYLFVCLRSLISAAVRLSICGQRALKPSQRIPKRETPSKMRASPAQQPVPLHCCRSNSPPLLLYTLTLLVYTRIQCAHLTLTRVQNSFAPLLGTCLCVVMYYLGTCLCVVWLCIIYNDAQGLCKRSVSKRSSLRA
jgi:hypothetical protein